MTVALKCLLLAPPETAARISAYHAARVAASRSRHVSRNTAIVELIDAGAELAAFRARGDTEMARVAALVAARARAQHELAAVTEDEAGAAAMTATGDALQQLADELVALAATDEGA